MSDQLVIRFSEPDLSSEQLVDWNLYNHNGSLQETNRSSLSSLYEEVSSLSDQFSITVIVSSNSVVLASTEIPSNQLRQIKQALPFMVEELIADDIESVHIAMPPQLEKGNTVDVAIVSHRAMVDWLDVLHSNHLSPSRLLVDVLCLPRAANSVTLLLDQESVIIRTDDYSGLIVDTEDFQLIFEGAMNALNSSDPQAPRPLINLIYSHIQDADSAEELNKNLQTYYSDYEIKVSQYDNNLLDILGNTACFQNQPTIDLLQGGYGQSQSTSNVWQKWRFVASIAVICLCTYLFTTLGIGIYFGNKADSLDREAVDLYKQLFPNERRIVSPKKQMENHLRFNGVVGNTHFLQLLADTSLQIGNADSQQLIVEMLRFDSEQGDLIFQVQTPSIDSLDKIKQTLAQKGLTVEINSATEQDDYVVGRFAVRRL